MSQTVPEARDPLTPTITPAQLKRERLRFSDFRFTRTPSGQCSGEVELEWVDGVRVVGKAGGQSSPMGDLRISADAALRALETGRSGWSVGSRPVDDRRQASPPIRRERRHRLGEREAW